MLPPSSGPVKRWYPTTTRYHHLEDLDFETSPPWKAEQMGKMFLLASELCLQQHIVAVFLCLDPVGFNAILFVSLTVYTHMFLDQYFFFVK
jgi:hypothetical protein